MRRWRDRLQIVIPTFLLVLSVAVQRFDPANISELRVWVFDEFQRLAPRPYQQVPVRIVDIDDESLARVGQWPWPRNVVAKLVDRLSKAGASAIAFDIVFAEPDRTSPSRALKTWPQLASIPEIRQGLSRLPDNDAVLAKSFSKGNVVTGFALTNSGRQAPARKSGVAVSGGAGESISSFLNGFPGAITNLAELEKAASGNGSFNTIPDQDGVVRHIPTFLALNGEVSSADPTAGIYPSLDLEALRVSQGVRQYKIKASNGHGETGYGQQTGIVTVNLGTLSIHPDPKGFIWLHYSGHVAQRFIPAWTLLDSRQALEQLKGAIVFIGTSAAGLKDQRATPLETTAPGVEIHAEAAEQILLNQYLFRPDYALGLESAYLILLGALVIFLLSRANALGGAALAACAIASAFLFSWTAFKQWRLLFDPLYPSLAIGAVYASGSLLKYVRTEQEKKRVRTAFSRYMSPALVEQLARHPERLRLGGEMRNMTLLFCDIRGFTTISEQFDPEGLTRLINRFLTPMTQIILDHQGTIDKYMGDCIMAFWNAPLDDPAHVDHACRAALRMMERLKRLNAELKGEAEASGRKPIAIHIGIGLNTGNCCVGNMGSDQRFDYSVLGDDVNLASRLEGQSKTYGVDIVIGPNTEARAKGLAALELDLIKVKGKTVPVRIFALLGDEKIKESQAFQDLSRDHGLMLAAYRAQRWGEARAQAASCRRHDFRLAGLYDLYEKRIAANEENSPGKDWDGVFTATSK